VYSYWQPVVPTSAHSVVLNSFLALSRFWCDSPSYYSRLITIQI
jgi:hypothetical protein